jgi:integrase/recombinase XerC
MEQDFLDHLKYERRYAAHTLLSYTNDLRQFREYLDSFDEDVPLQDVETFHIRNWIVELMDGDYAVTSVQRKLSTLKSFFRYVRKMSHRTDNPVSVIVTPKAAKRLPQFVDNQGMGHLFGDENLFAEHMSGMRDKLMLTLFYSTGMRLSELIALKENDFDFEGNVIRVLGKRNKERLIPTTDELKRLIQQYLAEKHKVLGPSEELILLDDGKKLYPKFVYRKVNEYLGRVTTLSKKSPHVLRHTFATHMLENGAELQSIKEILGHASLAATQVYTHNSIDRLKKIHTQAHPRG